MSSSVFGRMMMWRWGTGFLKVDKFSSPHWRFGKYVGDKATFIPYLVTELSIENFLFYQGTQYYLMCWSVSGTIKEVLCFSMTCGEDSHRYPQCANTKMLLETQQKQFHSMCPNMYQLTFSCCTYVLVWGGEYAIITMKTTPGQKSQNSEFVKFAKILK